MKVFPHRVVVLFLSLAFSLPHPAFALRPAGLEENAAKEEVLVRLSAGLEEPPFGRWLRTAEDAKRVEAIVEEYKGRTYPAAKKKGTREHGTKKTLIALKKEGYYVRFYELGVRDYFVFLWETQDTPPLSFGLKDNR